MPLPTLLPLLPLPLPTTPMPEADVADVDDGELEATAAAAATGGGGAWARRDMQSDAALACAPFFYEWFSARSEKRKKGKVDRRERH